MKEQIHIPQYKLPAAGSRSIVREAGLCLALFNVDGMLYAIDDSCPHGGGSLVMGKLDGLQVRCPAHGLQFDIRTGCMSSQGSLRARSYAITMVDGQTFVSPCPTSQQRAQP